MRQAETAVTVAHVRERLKRLDFIYQRFPIYFVTACTWKRQQLLNNDSVHFAFKDFAAAAPEHSCWVGAYVLMPDHLHLFIAIDDQRIRLSQWMKSLKGRLSAAFRAGGQLAPFWQKGFFDHLLRSSDSYSEKWRYVRENPVRAGLADSWNEWAYCGEICDLRFHHARL